MPSFRACLPAVAACLVLPFPVFAQSAPAPDPSPEIAAMQQVETAWDAAVAKHDQYAMENLLARDFVGIGAAGDVTTRNQQISHLFIAGAEPLALTQKVIDARIMGDVAVVNGTYVMSWQGEGEKVKVAEKGVFSHVFRRNSAGNWQCINSQRTVVATDEEKKRAAAKTKSNAALPLHIPLIYDGAKSTQASPAPGAEKPQP